VAFLEGYGWGLAMIIFIGPVVFTLLKNTIDKGRTAGIMVASGIIISDVVAVALLCSAGAINFLEKSGTQYWIALAGAVILLIMGAKYFLNPKVPNESKQRIKGRDKLASFTGGFLVNFVNPFVFVVWIGFIAYAEELYGNERSFYVFLSALLLGIFTQDLLKVLFAEKIKPFLQPKRLRVIYKVMGVFMVLFAIRLLVYALGVE